MLHELLNIWRWKHAYTMRQAAAIIGVSVGTYCRIEQGKKMDSDTLLRIIVWMCAYPKRKTDKNKQKRT